jgi:hypothetical protein
MLSTKLYIFLQKYWLLLIALATILFGIIAWQFSDSQLINVVGWIGLFLITAWAANVTLTSIQNIDNQQIKRAWRYIGVGLVLWAITVAIEGGYEIITTSSLKMPSPVDLLKLADHLPSS